MSTPIPTLDALRDCLAGTATLLDRALADAGRDCASELLGRPNGLYDLRAATDEAYGLSAGKDLCYDRPSTGLAYGLWYHARRVNTCLRQVLPCLRNDHPKSLVIYDLGAGTGAFQWAFALASYAFRRCGGTPPLLHIVNVDSSPVMLDYLGRVWEHFVRALPEIEQDVTFETCVNSWTRTVATTAEGWLCASYLFDHSDLADDLSRDFDRLLESNQPSRILLSTSARKGHNYLDAISRGMLARGYTRSWDPCPPVYSGRLYEVNIVRKDLNRRIPRMRPNATWSDPSHRGAVFVRAQTQLGMEQPVGQALKLFMPALPKRRDVDLTPEQEKAAELSDQPTLLYGSAGCGKSIVLTERLRLLVQSRDYDHNLRILVTTFNKGLVDLLKKWTSQLLDSKRYRVEASGASGATYEYRFRSAQGDLSKKPNLLLMHFDVLPTRIAKVHRREGTSVIVGDDQEEPYEKAVRALIAEAIERVRERLPALNVVPSQIPDHIFDVGFVRDELHRVVYGQRAYERESYLNADRPGRPIVQRGGRPREVLWEVLAAFSELTKERGVLTFLQRRIHLLDLLESGRVEAKYTHLFVDEIQDCTPADLRIFHELLTDPNQIFLTGDLAQAVHMGRSASTRLSATYPEFYGIRSKTLEGSFRLPFRVSEALVPLSRRIRDKRAPCKDSVDVVLSHPYKGSPPGVRPVVVAASSDAEMARKLLAVGHAYGDSLGPVGFSIGAGPLILENDPGLRQAIQEEGGKAWTDTILRLKGLEHPWIVWSTQAEVPADDDAEEFVYTILTRGSCVLVIALFPNPCGAYQAVLNTLKPESVLLWDEASAVAFQAAQKDRALNTDIEPHPDEDPDREN